MVLFLRGAMGGLFFMSLQKWGQSCGLFRVKPLQSTAQEGNLLVNKRSRVPDQNSQHRTPFLKTETILCWEKGGRKT
jgi:hypothetical protein